MAAFVPKPNVQRDSLRSLQVAFGPHVKGAGIALRAAILQFTITEVRGNGEDRKGMLPVSRIFHPRPAPDVAMSSAHNTISMSTGGQKL